MRLVWNCLHFAQLWQPIWRLLYNNKFKINTRGFRLVLCNLKVNPLQNAETTQAEDVQDLQLQGKQEANEQTQAKDRKY